MISAVHYFGLDSCVLPLTVGLSLFFFIFSIFCGFTSGISVSLPFLKKNRMRGGGGRALFASSLGFLLLILTCDLTVASSSCDIQPRREGGWKCQ